MENTMLKGFETLKIEQIYAHPENPRKELGDITELAESIKKNGVMQNLTVIPGHWDENGSWCTDGYTLLIGHRRCAAAKLAGLDEIPCKIIEGLSRNEQIATMLEENMQRSDLTVWEQAQGFQLMLDLGETEDSIAEKTGFSKTTVKHRLNIAKLDQNLLKEKEDTSAFQLSLTDLYALEQIKDVEKRNDILKRASTSRELQSKVQVAIEEARREKNAKQIIEMLEAEGLKEAPKEVADQLYSNKWETLEYYNLDHEVPAQIKKDKIEGGMYYVKRFREIRVIKKFVKAKEPQTEAERLKKQKESDAKEIKAIAKEMAAQREDFIRNILSGKIAPLKNTEAVVDKLWQAIVYGSGHVGKISLAKFLTNTHKGWYDVPVEDRDKAMEELDGLSTLHQLLIGAFSVTQEYAYTDYYNHYMSNTGKAVTAITEALSLYGFTYAEEEQYKVMEGSHRCYVKEEKNKMQ